MRGEYNEQNHFEAQETAPERETELRVMKERLENDLRNPETKAAAFGDFKFTFGQLGLTSEEAQELTLEVFKLLARKNGMEDTEREILAKLETIRVGDKTLVEILHEKLKGRADLIFSQVKPYLQGIKGKVLDFGAGDGQVTQKAHDELGLDIEGVDVRPYVAPGVSVKVAVFDGKRVDVPDGHYEAALMTNVAHHEKNNEQIIQELTRIVSHRLVIIETVPVGNSAEAIEKDRERTFMNDYLYNRLFHNADVPVPGTYETPQGWIDRFEAHGWKLVQSEDLGYDQPTIKDVHHLLVFEKGNSQEFSSEQLDKLATRQISDTELIKKGARYVNAANEPRLDVPMDEESLEKQSDRIDVLGMDDIRADISLEEKKSRRVDFEISELEQQIKEVYPQGLMETVENVLMQTNGYKELNVLDKRRAVRLALGQIAYCGRTIARRLTEAEGLEKATAFLASDVTFTTTSPVIKRIPVVRDALGVLSKDPKVLEFLALRFKNPWKPSESRN